jgi:tetratricopeptide (TPR) repeat protein
MNRWSGTLSRAMATRRSIDRRASPVPRWIPILLGAVFLAAVLTGAWLSWRPGGLLAPRPAAAPTSASIGAAPAAYVGEPACTRCHESQTREWRQSDHAHAMAEPTAHTVLGDFHGSAFSYAGTTSRFTTRGGRYFVTTDGPDGVLREYEVAYVFGITPLQQYLIRFPGGRLQCLGIAWDSRPAAQGGQRWFHLYPSEGITHDDPLHWTGPNQTWNYMCADCHSTNLVRGFDLAANAYRTTWSEINVSCEACHGPGSAHVAWAEARKKQGLTGRDRSDMGLSVTGLRAVDYSGFGVGDASSVAARPANRARQQAEVQACAPCHARRGPLTARAEPGRPFLDGYRPALLDEGLYYADGQIREEVYEFASFAQSRMYAAGVTCSDCHNAHSGKLRATGNNVCGHCHLPLSYDTPAHHHHKAGSDAARCVHCHMRATTYMVVDPRRDHSVRVPRVDYTQRYGIPNACTTPCHRDRSVVWAADAVVKWYGPMRARGNDYASAIDAGRRGLPEAETLLRAAATAPAFPPVARATALSLLRDVYSDASTGALEAGLGDAEPLVRAAAARAAEVLPPAERARRMMPLLSDPIRLVRAWAAASLAGVSTDLLTPAERVLLERAAREYVDVETAVAERPEAHLNLSGFYLRRGDVRRAQASLADALRLDPRNIPARVNLADIYRTLGRDADGERVLKQGLAISPDAADALHALGLLCIRQQRHVEGLAYLKHAWTLQPRVTRYGYVYAIGLQSAGDLAGAVRVLEDVQRRRPGDPDTLLALVSFERERGRREQSRVWAGMLARLRPDDPSVRRLVDELDAGRGGGR